eukprot:9262450-Pyramimonas_sp.AAC.1
MTLQVRSLIGELSLEKAESEINLGMLPELGLPGPPIPSLQRVRPLSPQSSHPLHCKPPPFSTCVMLASTSLHFTPLSSTFLHFTPLYSTLLHFTPLLHFPPPSFTLYFLRPVSGSLGVRDAFASA